MLKLKDDSPGFQGCHPDRTNKIGGIENDFENLPSLTKVLKLMNN